MSIRNDKVLYVPNWKPQHVKAWMLKRKLPTSMIKKIHNKYPINGKILLNLSKKDVKQFCHETNASSKHKFILADSVQNLQRQYYTIQRLTKKTSTNPSSRKKPKKYNTSGTYNTNNAENYGSYWTETQLKKAWILWLTHKNHKIVSQKIGRTHKATLTKINLIRRSISESNNVPYKINITDTKKIHHYNFITILNQQKQKENQKNQPNRMKDNGINVPQKSTNKNLKATQNNNCKANHNHNFKPTKKRHQKNNRNQRKFYKTCNYHNQLKQDIDNEQGIEITQQQLWKNDRQLSIKEKKQLQNIGIYVIEQLITHKKNAHHKECEFYVKWLDYSSEHNTWEPESNISPNMIKEYFIKNMSSKKKKQK